MNARGDIDPEPTDEDTEGHRFLLASNRSARSEDGGSPRSAARAAPDDEEDVEGHRMHAGPSDSFDDPFGPLKR